MKKIAAMEWSGYRKPSLTGIKKWKEYGFFYLESLTDPKTEESNGKEVQVAKKKGQKTESPAPIRRQREQSNAPKSPQLLLPLFESPTLQKKSLASKDQDILIFKLEQIGNDLLDLPQPPRSAYTALKHGKANPESLRIPTASIGCGIRIWAHAPQERLFPRVFRRKPTPNTKADAPKPTASTSTPGTKRSTVTG
jgi:hypothetical protein